MNKHRLFLSASSGWHFATVLCMFTRYLCWIYILEVRIIIIILIIIIIIINLGNRLKHVTGDKLELTYLFQRLSIAIQRAWQRTVF